MSVGDQVWCRSQGKVYSLIKMEPKLQNTCSLEQVVGGATLWWVSTVLTGLVQFTSRWVCWVQCLCTGSRHLELTGRPVKRFCPPPAAEVSGAILLQVWKAGCESSACPILGASETWLSTKENKARLYYQILFLSPEHCSWVWLVTLSLGEIPHCGQFW